MHLQIYQLPRSNFIQSLYTFYALNETAQNEIYINDDSITQIWSAEIAVKKVNFILDKTGMNHSVDKLWIDIGSGIGEPLFYWVKLIQTLNQLDLKVRMHSTKWLLIMA